MGKKIKLGKKPGNKKNIVKNAKRIQRNIEILKSLDSK
jgi:hypothetical protein